MLEILLVIAIFAIIVLSVGSFSINSFRQTTNNSTRLNAMLKSKEVSGAIVVNKNDLWQSIIDNSGGGQKYMSFASNRYEIADGSVVENGITHSFTISDVMRDINGDIVSSGGTVDLNTRLIDVDVIWTDQFEIDNTLNNSFYITNWNTAHWDQSSETDFNLGTTEFTLVTQVGDGSVELDQTGGAFYGDWCQPELTYNDYDLVGYGLAFDIMAEPGKIYLGTGGLSDTLTFATISVSDEEPPVVNVEGTFSGYKSFGAFGEENYGYFTSNENSKEVVILDISTPTYTEIGYVNAPGPSRGRAISVEGDRGYFTQSDELHIFDLTDKIGSRPILGSIELDDVGQRIQIFENTAYVLSEDTLKIYDVTDPADIIELASTDVDMNEAGRALFVNEGQTRAYMGAREHVYIVDLANKTGILPIINTYDSGLWRVFDINEVEDGNKMIVVGKWGEEYQVVDISDLQNLSHCGGFDIHFGISGVASVVMPETNNTFSYVIFGNPGSEFRVIRGGPAFGGGGGGGGSGGYFASGTYTSSVFDSGSVSTYYYSINWVEQQPAGTDIQFQVRSGDSADLSSVSWVGPDGTSGTYFTNPVGEYLPTVLNNHRYFQYKVYLTTSDSNYTPILEEVTINYQ